MTARRISHGVDRSHPVVGRVCAENGYRGWTHCATYPPRAPLIPTFPHGYPHWRRPDGQKASRGVEKSPRRAPPPPEAKPAPPERSSTRSIGVRTRLIAGKRTN